MAAKKNLPSSPADTLINGAGNPVIFINYRHSETTPYAEHLYQSLITRFGKNKVFRDLSALELGDNYHLVIEQAISSATVMIVLAGRQWLTVKKRGAALRRLDEPDDYVRLEIEIGLRAGIKIIPVMVDGAEALKAEDLPPSIKALAAIEAHHFTWHEDMIKLQEQVWKFEKEKVQKAKALQALRERLDLTASMNTRINAALSKLNNPTFEIVLHAMERSLKAQGLPRTTLSLPDLICSLKKVMNVQKIGYWFLPDLLYVIDILGVKELKSRQRFIARSYAFSSLDDIPGHMKQNRPVIAGFFVPEKWWMDNEATKETITVAKKLSSSAFGIIAGWDPYNNLVKIQTPQNKWGENGIITMTRKVADKIINRYELHYIEAVKKPETMIATNPGIFKEFEKADRGKRKR